MFTFQTFLMSSVVILVVPLDMIDAKILDFNSDNALFHPFVQKIRNYRSKDYLIKLLKRNLEQKLKLNQKFNDEKMENENRDEDRSEKNRCHCNCPCHDRSLTKRCEGCHSKEQPEKGEYQSPFKNFICENEGSFADPNDCRQFYICFHNENDPIEVTCPTGFAFDSSQGKCSRKAARECTRKMRTAPKRTYY